MPILILSTLQTDSNFLTAFGFQTCNLQALPIYLDKLVNQFVAIILSVTFVLFFGEVCLSFCYIHGSVVYPQHFYTMKYYQVS